MADEQPSESAQMKHLKLQEKKLVDKIENRIPKWPEQHRKQALANAQRSLESIREAMKSA